MESKPEKKEKEKEKENKNQINWEKPKGKGKESWYKKREAHWASKEPTLISVLGGFEKSHLPDVKCSCELLNGLILSKQLNPGTSLDCGAGIGRVTEYVLCNFFKEIDLVEKDKKFIEKCKIKFNKSWPWLGYFKVFKFVYIYKFGDRKKTSNSISSLY